MKNIYSIWLRFYLYALKCADENQPTFFSSRIDGALLPAMESYEK